MSNEENRLKVLLLGKGQTHSYDKTMHIFSFIQKNIQDHSSKVALCFDEEELRYDDLGRKINQLANYLIQQGIVPNDRIAVLFSPSIEMVISILAIIRIGACYVPVDSYYPLEYAKYIIDDSSPQYILTNNINNPLCLLFEKKIIFYPKIKKFVEKQSIEFLENYNIKGEDPAYILYTSGSTGKPKGVLVPHRAVNNHMLWMLNEFSFSKDDKILLKTPISFDASVWEIFLPFYIGASSIIAHQNCHIDPKNLMNMIIKHNITTIQLVPIILYELLQISDIINCQSLKRVFCGGESLSFQIKKLFSKKLSCNLINLYGPAEATIDTTFCKIEPNSTNLQIDYIGKPIWNTQLYVLSNDYTLCNIGEEGELYIGGDNLALGYWGNETLTKQKFIDNPFILGTKIYQTGDKVRWTESGHLEYIGRATSQLKINGVRIEIAPIISFLIEEFGLLNCFIIKQFNRKIYGYLACYLILGENKELSIDKIKEVLIGKYPRNMIPRKFFIIDETPLSPNGKLDISKLINLGNVHRENRNIIKSKDEISDFIFEMWEKILSSEVTHELDNFFQIGGDSIATIRLCEELEKKFQIELTINELLINPTVKQQVDLIKNKQELQLANNAHLSFISPVVCLKSNGINQPIFLIHPIGGTIFWYTHLANLMKCDHPVYGISDPSILNSNISFSSIQDMAKYYVALIQKVQPSGSYIIGGASFGTTIAIEVANLLKQEGQVIDVILSLDGWAIYPASLHELEYFKKSMLKQQNEWRDKFYIHCFDKKMEDLFKIQLERLSFLNQYKMLPIEDPFILFKSIEIMPVFMNIDSPYNLWDGFVKNIRKIIVPGNHETMFQYPHVTTLAMRVDNILNEVLSGNSHTKEMRLSFTF